MGCSRSWDRSCPVISITGVSRSLDSLRVFESPVHSYCSRLMFGLRVRHPPALESHSEGRGGGSRISVTCDTFHSQ